MKVARASFYNGFGIRVFGFESDFQIPFDFFTEPSARDVVGVVIR